MSRHETIEIVLAEGGHVGSDWEDIQVDLAELLIDRYGLVPESVDVSTLLVADEAAEPEPATVADNTVADRPGAIQIGPMPRRAFRVAGLGPEMLAVLTWLIILTITVVAILVLGR